MLKCRPDYLKPNSFALHINRFVTRSSQEDKEDQILLKTDCFSVFCWESCWLFLNRQEMINSSFFAEFFVVHFLIFALQLKSHLEPNREDPRFHYTTKWNLLGEKCCKHFLLRKKAKTAIIP